MTATCKWINGLVIIVAATTALCFTGPELCAKPTISPEIRGVQASAVGADEAAAIKNAASIAVMDVFQSLLDQANLTQMKRRLDAFVGRYTANLTANIRAEIGLQHVEVILSQREGNEYRVTAKFFFIVGYFKDEIDLLRPNDVKAGGLICPIAGKCWRLPEQADVNAKGNQVFGTALTTASQLGRVDVVRALLAKGADVNAKDNGGLTALILASQLGRVDVVKALLDGEPTSTPRATKSSGPR